MRRGNFGVAEMNLGSFSLLPNGTKIKIVFIKPENEVFALCELSVSAR
jgi:hypothetical protein